MFSTLESTWDQSARRGWTTLASLAMQAGALCLMLAASMIWIEHPPEVRWLQTPAPTFLPSAPEPPPIARGHIRAATVSNMSGDKLITPAVIPWHAVDIDDSKLGPPAPNLPEIDFGARRGSGVPYSIGMSLATVVPAQTKPSKPLVVSELGEGMLLHKVQPIYPAPARAVGVHGSVELRAVIGKDGTIKNLEVVSGHPFLARAAVEAVRQWRYRPYLLNHEPIEVETEITVNFLLSGG